MVVFTILGTIPGFIITILIHSFLFLAGDMAMEIKEQLPEVADYVQLLSAL